MRVERLGRFISGSESGLELLYLANGAYYPSLRFYGPTAAQQMEEWYTLNPGRRFNTRVREVTRTTPPYDWAQDYEEEETDDMATSRAFDAGKELGAALIGVFEVKVTPNFQAASDLAWAFAKALGFADSDSAREFAKAFLGELSNSSPKLLSASVSE